MLTWGAEAYQLVSGFFTKRTDSCIVVKSVGLLEEGGSRASYSIILLISPLVKYFLFGFSPCDLRYFTENFHTLKYYNVLIRKISIRKIFLQKRKRHYKGDKN